MSISLLKVPDPHSQYGSGCRRAKSIWIHADPDSGHWSVFAVKKEINFDMKIKNILFVGNLPISLLLVPDPREPNK
jgi:hypothetical protein